MSNYARYRDWHKWIGLILLIPLTVIATTGFLWNHERTLGIKHEEHHKPERSAMAATPSALQARPGTGSDHVGSIEAAVVAAREQWGQDVELDRIELKNEPGAGLVVKVKASEDSDVRPYEIVWSVAESAIIERKGDPANGTDWAGIVHDLHTGKFFSRRYGFLWSDSSAVALVALGATGLILYTIPLLKKRAKRQTSAAPGATTPVRAVHRRPVATPSAVLATATDSADVG